MYKYLLLALIVAWIIEANTQPSQAQPQPRLLPIL